jgi:hypothetical protein
MLSTKLLTALAADVATSPPKELRHPASQKQTGMGPGGGLAPKDQNEEVQQAVAGIRSRLTSAWRTADFMSITLFVLLVSMAVTAVVAGLVLQKPMVTVITGGVSGASLFTVLIWKPLEKVLQAQQAIQRLDVLMLALRQEWDACDQIPDAQDKLARLREVNNGVLDQLKDFASG